MTNAKTNYWVAPFLLSQSLAQWFLIYPELTPWLVIETENINQQALKRQISRCSRLPGYFDEADTP